MLDLSASSPELCDTGGGFALPGTGEEEKRLIENFHEHPSLQPFSRVELHALAFPGDSLLALTMEEEVQDFQQCPQPGLKLPPMTPFHRRIASDCAKRHGLEAMSMGNGVDRHVVILKTGTDVVSPLLMYHDAMPSALGRDKLHAAIAFKRRNGAKAAGVTTEFVNVGGQVIDCKVVSACDHLKQFHVSKQDSDRSDWMKLVHETVSRGVPIATHAHIVEVRVSDPRRDQGQFAELQKFLGPFHVRWLDDQKETGVGVIVYPSVPAANNCLDRFEDEADEDGTNAPFQLYPFAPHIFGAFIDDQASRRFGSKGESGSSTPIGRSPSSQGGSWRDGAGAGFLDRHMGGRWHASLTPPLVPRDPAASPPLHPKGGSWSPLHGTPKVSPHTGPTRSPGVSANPGPCVQPLSLGRGRWLEVRDRSTGARHQDSTGRCSIEIALPGDKVKDVFSHLDVVDWSKTGDGLLLIEFGSAEDAESALKTAAASGLSAKSSSQSTARTNGTTPDLQPEDRRKP